MGRFMDWFMDWFMEWTEEWIFPPLFALLIVALVIHFGSYVVRGECVPTVPYVAESVRHSPEGTTLVMVGKVLTPIHHPEANWANVAGTYARTGGACMARINLTSEQYMELSGEARP